MGSNTARIGNSASIKSEETRQPANPLFRFLSSGGASGLLSLAVVMVTTLLVLPHMAAAQTASQIVPPTFAPQVERHGGFTLPGAAGLATPEGAEQLHVKLSGVTVDGGFPALATASSALRERLSDREISGAEVFAAARDLEAAYAAAGYVLVRVILPPQMLVNDSQLRLVVVDGFIERVETKDLPEQVRQRIAKLVEPLAGRRGIRLSEIERQVLLAGDTPGVLLRSTLAPGTVEGATVLVIEAKYQKVSGTVTYDNTLSESLGRHTLGTGLDFNSIFGLGELVYLRSSGHPGSGNSNVLAEYPRNRTLAGGVILPLWIDGLTFNAEYTNAHTTQETDLAGVQTTDELDRLSLRLKYGWLRSRAANFYSELSFDAENETQSLLIADAPIAFSQDRVRVMRLTNEGDVLLPWGAAISGRATASFGLDALGARRAADATALLPLSRQGADATFQKIDISADYSQTLLDHLAIDFSARAQTSFNAPLLSGEQIGIASSSGLSSFNAGSISGDEGYVLRGEISSPWNLPTRISWSEQSISVQATPYVFGAYGQVFLNDPTAVEDARVHATAFGAGLRVAWGAAGSQSRGSLTLEYGRGERSGDASASNRFTVLSAIRF